MFLITHCAAKQPPRKREHEKNGSRLRGCARQRRAAASARVRRLARYGWPGARATSQPEPPPPHLDDENRELRGRGIVSDGGHRPPCTRPPRNRNGSRVRRSHLKAPPPSSPSPPCCLMNPPRTPSGQAVHEAALDRSQGVGRCATSRPLERSHLARSTTASEGPVGAGAGAGECRQRPTARGGERAESGPMAAPAAERSRLTLFAREPGG